MAQRDQPAQRDELAQLPSRLAEAERRIDRLERRPWRVGGYSFKQGGGGTLTVVCDATGHSTTIGSPS